MIKIIHKVSKREYFLISALQTSVLVADCLTGEFTTLGLGHFLLHPNHLEQADFRLEKVVSEIEKKLRDLVVGSSVSIDVSSPSDHYRVYNTITKLKPIARFKCKSSKDDKTITVTRMPK